MGATSEKALERGVKINEIIKEAAGVLGGGGGGKPQLAQGAGKEGSKMPETLEFVGQAVRESLSRLV